METICITMPQEEKDKLMGFLRWLIRDTRAALEWLGIEEYLDKISE